MRSYEALLNDLVCRSRAVVTTFLRGENGTGSRDTFWRRHTTCGVSSVHATSSMRAGREVCVCAQKVLPSRSDRSVCAG
jgi:hypothetical protein